MAIPSVSEIDWSHDHYGVLSKLIFNESLVANTEGMMRTLGFVHLYSASGIHIYALLECFDRLFEKVNQICGGRALWLKRVALYALFGMLFYLWELQEFRLGFARPVLIFLIRAWSRERGVKWRIFYPLLIAFVLDLILQIDSGRLHYYLAVGGGLFGLEWAKSKKPGLLNEHISMAFGSWLLTALIDLCSNHQVCWMTPLWSLLTIPIISYLFYPLTVLSFVLFGRIPEFVFNAWNALLDFCIWIADRGLTFSIVDQNSVFVALVGALVCTIVLKIAQWRNRSKMTAIAFTILILLMIRIYPVESGTAQVVQLDVKQGDAMILKKALRVEMVDAGGEKANKPAQWIQKLARHGVSRIDTVLFTHLDEDHVGGILNLLEYVPIGSIYSHTRHWNSKKGAELRSKILERREIRFGSANDIHLMKVAWFESRSTKADGNGFMAGIVAPLDQNRVYLAAGDSDHSQERQFIQYFKPTIESYSFKIWKASHHGSRYSSGLNELNDLKPTRIWISVGKFNHYHHPSIYALGRMRELNLDYLRTDIEGDLVE